MSENESVESTQDVGAESSPAVEETSSELSSNDNQKLTSESQSKPEMPFHEHPRFKELIEQKNQFAEKATSYERQLAQMAEQIKSLQMPKTPVETPQSKLISRLKGIDPEFGQFVEALQNQSESKEKELSELKQWRDSYQRESYLANARNITAKAQGELKVDPALHNMYLSQIPGNTPLDKIEAAYKAVHDQVNKLFEARERAALSKYTESKKSDSKVPTTTKTPSGKNVPKSSKPEYSRDHEEAKNQIVANALKAYRQNTG